MKIGFDRYAMAIDGHPKVIRSGAMHYFRLPGPEMWRDRLHRLKAAGYNAVDLYFCWGFHSAAPGEYDFTGVRDVRLLLKMVEEAGLYLIARPGPYINAEVTGGGLPGWLLARPDVALRNRRPGGQFEWSQPYMDAVREWYDQILPLIRECPNLLMIQVENEYATEDLEPDYIRTLIDWVRQAGISVPTMHNDMFAMGLYEDLVDIYAFDHYSVTAFEADWRGYPHVFQLIDNVEGNLRPFCQNRPLMVTELQAGWFAGWQGWTYEQIIRRLGREHISLTTKSLLGQGLSVFSHYMAIGGTNWDHLASTDTYTSYEFAAPVTEAGLNTNRYFDMKALNYFLESFGDVFVRTEPVKHEDHQESLYATRKRVDGEGVWRFWRNLTRKPVAIATESGASILLKPMELLILPENIPLQCGGILIESNVELLYQTDRLLFLKADRPVHCRLRLSGEHSPDGDLPSGPQGAPWSIRTETAHDHSLDPNLLQQQGLTVILLSARQAERFWVEPSGRIVIGPEESLPDGRYGFADTNPLPFVWTVYPNGELDRMPRPELKTQSVPLLSDWQIVEASPELASDASFRAVSPNGLDLDANALYEGEAWYELTFGPDASVPGQIALKARHFWYAYLNGQQIAHGCFFPNDPEQQEPPLETFSLPAGVWRPGEANRLVILTSGLGHPKGFHDDAQTPQGLLSLQVDDQPVEEDSVRISGGFNALTAGYPAVDALPDSLPEGAILKLESRFELPDDPEIRQPVGLQIPDLGAERMNIFLNGTLVGRHWQACARQTCYVLPEGLLRREPSVSNDVSLIAFGFNQPVRSEALRSVLPELKLVPYGTFTVARP
jgi:hypothetical protein